MDNYEISSIEIRNSLIQAGSLSLLDVVELLESSEEDLYKVIVRTYFKLKEK